ncbi:helix-turn-helix domain-containing protein [Cohaesibacter celericrescens]|uniref:Transcriptional regulator n=1 Tax=Cohaesibacter celericrescens TaxID=2067669 RepID=A0A2N5XXK8_9HYPH|nr:helix-turn-helix transcriptional regulator [Cohaesibacter celericrescens]PLW79207.1 transcriptional regulator [Cohaesibacter celericrescens]
MQKNSRFSENLRYACSQKQSISHVCRDVKLNRQQFNRYINGTARPAAYNLSRIAHYFGLQATDFDNASSVFRLKLSSVKKGMAEKNKVNDGFPGDLKALRRYLGYYQTYHVSLSWPGSVICSCCHLSEHDGLVYSKSIERIRNTEWEIKQITKYIGQVAYMRDRLFIVEKTARGQPIISQTTLLPFPEHQRLYLKGLSTGISWRNENMPYATRMIWRSIGSNPDKRVMLSKCGIASPRSRLFSPTIRKFLFDANGESATLTLA